MRGKRSYRPWEPPKHQSSKNSVGGPGSVRLRFSCGTVQAIPVSASAVPLRKGGFLCFSTVQERGTVPVPVLVPERRFRRFRFRFRFLDKRFRRFRFPVVRFGYWATLKLQKGKNSLNIKFSGTLFLGYQGPNVGISLTPTLGCPGQKLYARGPCLSIVLEREWPGCPAIWVGRSRDQKNLMQENVGLIFCSLFNYRKYSGRIMLVMLSWGGGKLGFLSLSHLCSAGRGKKLEKQENSNRTKKESKYTKKGSGNQGRERQTTVGTLIAVRPLLLLTILKGVLAWFSHLVGVYTQWTKSSANLEGVRTRSSEKTREVFFLQLCDGGSDIQDLQIL